MKSTLVLSAAALVLTGCFQAPRYLPGEQIRPLGAKAPTYNGANDAPSVAAFATGIWKVVRSDLKMPGSMNSDLSTYGPFLSLGSDGRAEYRVGTNYSVGKWWCEGSSIRLQFTEHHVPRLRTDPPTDSKRDAGYRLHLMALEGVESIDISDDKQHLYVNRGHGQEWERCEIKKN